MYARMYVCMYVCMHIYVHIHICMYVCIYIYIYDVSAHSRCLGASYEASVLLFLILLSCGAPLYLQCEACRSAALAKSARAGVHAYVSVYIFTNDFSHPNPNPNPFSKLVFLL